MKIEIKKQIADKIKQRLKSTNEFKSVEEYVNYILEKFISKLTTESKSEQVYSKEDENKIKEKLKGLGYID